MKASIDIINCRDLSAAQLENLRRLSVSKDQVEFGGTFGETLDAGLSDRSGAVQAYCFLKDDAPIGIVALKRAPATADWVPPNAVSLHGFKIDVGWQGKGLGKTTFRLAVGAAVQKWPDAQQLVLAVDAANSTALAVYRSFGMTDSGPVYSGRIGKEHRLSMRIGPSGIHQALA